MKVLIAGAGPAGLTLAFWLHRYGIEAQVLERASEIRTGGYMIDFFGTGYDVAERMDILAPLSEEHYAVPEVQFVDAQGRRQSGMSLEQLRTLVDDRFYNFPRGSLVKVLHQTVRDRVDIRTGVHITDVANLEGDGPAQVTLSDGSEQEVDVVVGADGIHSSLRKMAFCPHSEAEHFLGYHCGSFRVPRIHDEDPAFYSYTEPGKLMSYYPLRDDETAIFFMYEADSDTLPSRGERRAYLREQYRGMGWRTHEILDMLHDDTDLYYDTVTQIKIDPWYKGKAVLLGDAAYCMTLLSGQGASFAMGGAYLLAYELQRQEQASAAFANYQRTLFDEIRRRQDAAVSTSKFFCPNSRWTIWVRNVFTKIMFWPIMRSIAKKQLGAQSALPDEVQERVTS